MAESKPFASEVLERLSSSYGVKTQKELAVCLDVSPANVSAWMQRGSVPGTAIIKCALDTEADLRWLVSGESAKENTYKEKRLSLGISGKEFINTMLSTGGRPVLDRILQAYGFSSQKELSQYLEISTGTISTWVRRRFFPGDIVITCALETGVSLKWLATGDDSYIKNNNAVPDEMPDFFKVSKLKLESGSLNNIGFWYADISFIKDFTINYSYVEGVKYSWLINSSKKDIGNGRWLIILDGSHDVFDIARLPAGRLILKNESIHFECHEDDISVYGAVLITIEKNI